MHCIFTYIWLIGKRRKIYLNIPHIECLGKGIWLWKFSTLLKNPIRHQTRLPTEDAITDAYNSGVRRLGIEADWLDGSIWMFPKMDGENHGKPYVQMDDLGGFPIIFGNTHLELNNITTVVVDLERKILFWTGQIMNI